MDSAAKPQVTKHTLPPRLAYADGVVYASQGRLYALDASDGRIVRDYDLHSSLDFSVVAGVIYADATAKDANGEYTFSYQATNAACGALRWRAFTSTDRYVAMSVRVGPLRLGGTVGDDDQPA
jgi:outer membrane protein assembly factor BamB